MLRRTILSIILLAITGCNSGNYQSYDSGVGYDSEPLENNIYHVTYTGTQSTKIEKVNDFALLRSAELTLEKGYKYFVIIEAKNNATSVKSSRRMAVATSGMGMGMPNPANAEGSHVKARAKSELTIELHNEKPQGISYDAYMIEQGLKSEYEIAS